LKEKFEVAYRAKRVELQNNTSFLEHKDNIISQQQLLCGHSDPMVLYMDNFIEVEMHDKENNQNVSFCSEHDLAFENLEQEKSAFEEKDTVKKEACMFLYNCEHEGTIDACCPFFFIDKQVIFTHRIQDPFASLLETSEKETFMSYLQSDSGIGSSKWMRFQIGFNFQYEFPLSRVMQGIQSVDKVLIWLHWIFDVT
jgi:hypothetical protein